MYERPLQFVSTTYTGKTGTAVVTPDAGMNLVFVGATINNRSGATIKIGVGFKSRDERWLAGTWDASEDPEFINDTTDAQDAGAGDFLLFSTTNNDGFAVQSLDKFGIVGVTVSQAVAGGSPVFAYAYWNGSTYAALTLIETPDWATTGEKSIVFSPPMDWTAVATGSQAATDGFTVGMYVIRVIATTAPTVTTGLATLLWSARLYDFKEGVTDNTLINFIPEDSKGLRLQAGESLIPYFETAGADNTVSFRFREIG